MTHLAFQSASSEWLAHCRSACDPLLSLLFQNLILRPVPLCNLYVCLFFCYMLLIDCAKIHRNFWLEWTVTLFSSLPSSTQPLACTLYNSTKTYFLTGTVCSVMHNTAVEQPKIDPGVRTVFIPNECPLQMFLVSIFDWGRSQHMTWLQPGFQPGVEWRWRCDSDAQHWNMGVQKGKAVPHSHIVKDARFQYFGAACTVWQSQAKLEIKNFTGVLDQPFRMTSEGEIVISVFGGSHQSPSDDFPHKIVIPHFCSQSLSLDLPSMWLISCNRYSQ